LNKIVLPGTVWVASDIHLGPDAPATAREFYAFLDKACARADALLLCGDIFDAWIGDDLAVSTQEGWLIQAIDALRRTSARIPLWLGHGNRDFLLGSQFAQHVGARLLPEKVLLVTQAGEVILSHGDEYCTEDLAYQRFRRMVRNKTVQGLFLSLSPGIRQKIALSARRRSMASHGHKTATIMDVTPAAIEYAFAETQAALLVHGHTHRPAVHNLLVNDKSRQRIVLPDWEFDHAQPGRGGWLSLDTHGATLNPWAARI
jgi:UDP-2,3-diacylglucosamine hydrolase